jgi:MFS transporter, DHA1 family, inner membrane transport protein
MAELAPTANPPPAKLPPILAHLSLGNFVVGMGAFVMVGIISPIADGLDISKADASLALTAYALAYAVLSPVGAALTGRFSRRAVLAAALGLFCLGSIASALAPTLGVLVFARIIVAFGAALYTPLSAGLAVALVPPEQRGRALARVFFGMTLAQVMGVPLGAWLAYRFGWHSTFWTVAALAAVSTVILLRVIPARVAFQPTSLATIVSTLSNLRLMFAISFTATIMTAVYILFTYFGPLIEASAGPDAETRTLYLVIYGLGAVAGNMIGGQLTDRIGPTRTLVMICIVQMLVMPFFSIMPWEPVPFTILITLWSVFGWSFMAPQQARLAAIAPHAQALALALNAAMIYVGIAIGSGIGGRLLAWNGMEALGIFGGLGAAIALLHLLASSRNPKAK